MIRVTCPVCGRAMQGQSPAEWPQLPFCSPRCKSIDLGRWLGERYRIPAEDPEDTAPAEETDLP